MAKYRIKKHSYIDFTEDFEVQKKLWFFPFLYNFNNVDAYTTGFYDTMEDAQKAIQEDKYKIKTEIIEVN